MHDSGYEGECLDHCAREAFFNAHMVLHLSMPSSEAVAENISVYLSVLMITQRSHVSFKIS